MEATQEQPTMTDAEPDQLLDLAESIATSLDRIADALELLCLPHADVLAAPTGQRPAIYEALRAIAVNVDRA